MTETSPAEFVLAFATVHMVATRILPDQNPAAGTGLSKDDLPEVVGKGFKRACNFKLRDDASFPLQWVLPGVSTLLTLQIIVAINVGALFLRKETTPRTVILGALSNVISCHHVSIKEQLVNFNHMLH